MAPATMRLIPAESWRCAVGVGGIGSGLFFALEGNEPLGRDESRPARMLEIRDYCKLHIVFHHVAVLLGAGSPPDHFRVCPVGKVGNDAAGTRLLEEMRQAGIDTRFVEVAASAPTLLSVCYQFPDGAGGNITTSTSAAALLTAADIDGALAAIGHATAEAIVVALPEVPLSCRRHLLQKTPPGRALRVAAFTSSEIYRAREEGVLRHVDLLAMNEDEARAATAMRSDPLDTPALLGGCRELLTCLAKGGRIIVTAGSRGAYAVDVDSVDYCPAAAVPVASTAGAGDALIGGVLAGLAAGLPFKETASSRVDFSDRPLSTAFDLGCLVAAFSVTSQHTIHPELGLRGVLELAESLGVSVAPSLRSRIGAGGPGPAD